MVCDGLGAWERVLCGACLVRLKCVDGHVQLVRTTTHAY